MTERAKYWQELVHEQQRSGLSQAAFCRQRRINAGTFAWWRRKLRDEAAPIGTRHSGSGRRTSRPEPVRFAEFELVGSGARRYEILLPGGRILRVPTDFDPDQVARLIRAVESAC
jgi:hypothetical protein